MPNQLAKAVTMMNGTKMKPAFWSQSGASPAAVATIAGLPPSLPKMPAVMTSGTTNCTTLTPRLPRPAFSAAALPFSVFGKKKEMLDMEEAKLPPPKPQKSARRRKMK